MKKANFWIVGTFLLITLFHYVDALMISEGRLYYLSLAYFAAFVISMFMTRKSKACNLFYLIYSFVLCVAIIISLTPSLLLGSDASSVVYYLSTVLIDPIISLAVFLWGGPNTLALILGIVLLYLFPFIAACISFYFYTKNRCQ